MALTGRLKNNIKVAGALCSILFITSCGNETTDKKNDTASKITTPEIKRIPTPDFNADSAYSFVKAQVDFGPRIPGTSAHAKCADYLSAKLKSYGFTVHIQNGTVQTYDEKKFI